MAKLKKIDGCKLAWHSLTDDYVVTTKQACFAPYVGGSNECPRHPVTLARWRIAGRGPRYLRVEGRIHYRIGDLRQYALRAGRTSTTNDPVQA